MFFPWDHERKEVQKFSAYKFLKTWELSALLSRVMPCQGATSPASFTLAPLPSHSSFHQDFSHAYCFCTEQDMMGVIITIKTSKINSNPEKTNHTHTQLRNKVTIVGDCAAILWKQEQIWAHPQERSEGMCTGRGQVAQGCTLRTQGKPGQPATSRGRRGR